MSETKLHIDMINKCKEQLGSSVMTGREYFSQQRKLCLRPKLIPDIMRDNKLAVECLTLIGKSSTINKYTEKFDEVIVVFPFSPKVHEIWLYNDGELAKYRKFTKQTEQPPANVRA